MKFSVISSIIFVLLVSGVFAAEILTTDINGDPKYDFEPQEDVYIQGIGFVPNSFIDITIIRPDSSVESCDSSSCHYRYPQGQISSDEEGDFTILYDLNGIRGNYSVTVSDGTNTVYTTFLDAKNIINATVNGVPSTTVDPGDSILVSITVKTAGSGLNDDWKSTQYRIEGGSWTCVNTNDYTATGTNTEFFNINAPAAAGTYDLELIANQFNLCLGPSSNTFNLSSSIIVTSVLCGDLEIDFPETCEDNNTQSGDGCSVCQEEEGWECEGLPSQCYEVCGNGIITQSEECDDDNDDDGDGCSSSCDVEEGWVCESEEEGDESECITLNPELPDSCGLDVALIIDSSASMSNSDIAQIKSVLNGIANELLPSTPTEIAVVDFDNTATLLQDYTSNLTLIETAVNSIVRNGFTNWEDALEEVHEEFNNRLDKPDLYIFAGGGNPNAHGDGPNLDFPFVATAFAVQDADQIKLDGVRVITLGFSNNPAESRLKQISSEDAYYSNSSFDTLGAEIKEKAIATCSLCGDNETQELNDFGQEEECDDGNIKDGDGCSSTCQLEGVTSPVMPSVMLIFMLVALLVIGMKK